MKLVIYKINPKKNTLNFFLLLTLIALLFQVYIAIKSEVVGATTQCARGNVTSTTLGDNRTVVVTFTSATALATASCTFTVPNNIFAVDYLVVAGGGGGASGGGGGGGLVTSWHTRSATSTWEVTSRQSPLSVTPGDDISVTVGAGGAGGAAGNLRGSDAGIGYESLPGNGGDSSFGSVTAVGGGAGGHNESYVDSSLSTDSLRNGRGQNGGSGGGASFDQATTSDVSASSQSTVVGATTRGNAGGSSSGSGGFRAGAGGGGAGTSGGAIRTCNNGHLSNSLGCGGHGGNGLRSDIATATMVATTATTYVTYSCGGGGGVNANVDQEVTNGGGDAGCASAGRGSRWGNTNTNYTTSTQSNNANATSASASFGGGGGGTDPEDTRGGSGGSGVVIIRYTLPDPACPNSNNSTSTTTPIACRANVSISAGGGSVTTFLAGGPISYVNSGNSPSVSIVITPSGLSATATATSIAVSAPSGSSLAGGTYPLIYRITEGSNTSDSVLMVNVTDPGQRTPVVVLVDPRATQVDLPSILVGNVSATLVCVTPRASNEYANRPAVARTVEVSNVTATTFTNTGGIRLTGNNNNMSTQVQSLRVTAPNSERLIPGNSSRFLDVNVSNTASGGNGSCSGGTESSIELRLLGIDLTIIKGNVGLKR